MNNMLPNFISRYLLSPLDPPQKRHAAHSAAVLVPLINRPEMPTLLFTQRSKQLRQHPGQVAFPGGKHDVTDHTLYETALRETREEVGINSGSIQLLGELPTVNSRTGHNVKPFLALVEPDVILTPNPDEVAAVFEVPLSYVLQRRHYVTLSMGLPHAQRAVHFLPYSSHLIWGMTANILYRLCTQIESLDSHNKK